MGQWCLGRAPNSLAAGFLVRMLINLSREEAAQGDDLPQCGAGSLDYTCLLTWPAEALLLLVLNLLSSIQPKACVQLPFAGDKAAVVFKTVLLSLLAAV